MSRCLILSADKLGPSQILLDSLASICRNLELIAKVAKSRCQDVSKFGVAQRLTAQSLIVVGTPVHIALEKHWPVLCEGHVPPNKDKVGACLVRDFGVSQYSIPVRQHASVIRTLIKPMV